MTTGSQLLSPAVLVAAALAAATASPAQAQDASARPVCGNRDAIADRLRRTYGEVLWASYLSGAGTLVEIYRSRSGTVTVLEVAPRPGGGTACLVSEGEAFELARRPGRPA